jgi:hypothetical protein
MEMPILTEQQRWQATINYAHRLGRRITRGTHKGDEALCIAQQKEDLKCFVEWGQEPCPHRSHNAKYFKPKSACGKDWQELKEKLAELEK